MRVTVGLTRDVDVVDEDCPHRSCFWLYFDKGSFTPGVGYTSYYEKERPCCGTRHMHGCPHVGGHIVCGGCRHVLGVYDGDECPVPRPCAACGSTDLMYFADSLLPPSPCCASPSVARSRGPRPPRSQRCKGCGTVLRGVRLEAARRAA